MFSIAYSGTNITAGRTFYFDSSLGSANFEYNGEGSMRIDEVAAQLSITVERQVLCKGRPLQQWIASAPVILTRTAKPKKAGADGRRQPPVPSEPLAARLGSASGAIVWQTDEGISSRHTLHLARRRIHVDQGRNHPCMSVKIASPMRFRVAA